MRNFFFEHRNGHFDVTMNLAGFYGINAETGEAFQVDLDEAEIDAALTPLIDGKVQCSLCPKILSGIATGRRHYTLAHIHNVPQKCKICLKIYKNRLSLNKHINRGHGLSIKDVEKLADSL